MLDDHDLRFSLIAARNNWRNWRDVYEHTGPIASNPLLSEPGRRFGKFCKEYSVHRTIRVGTLNEFRLTLIKMRPAAIRDDTAESLDQLERRVRPNFGTHNGTRSMISVISKVATFVRPERFVAWDQYARRGINIIVGRSQNALFESYAIYLQAFDEVWNGDLGERIRRHAKKNGANPLERESSFLRRVLDVALMKCGGREL